MSDASTPSGVAAPGRRFLLVGRSSVEQTLRGRADVELLRARTGTDAIGELALAQDEHAPIELVMIGDDVVRNTERAGFESALRATDSSARIVHIAGQSEAAVLAMISDRPTSADSKPAGVTDAPPAEQPSSPAAPSQNSVLDAVLSGCDPTQAFLQDAKTSTGDSSLRFEREFDRAAPANASLHVASVARHGVTFGHLVAAHSSDATLERLGAELAGWLALHEQQRQLRTAAFTDQLTDAWNRRYFDYFMPHAIENARRRRNDVTLMVYDIDDFKTYNDRYGHSAGDDILKETVRLLLSVIRPTDRVCRIGGDEFAVIFDDPTGPREGAGHHPTSIAGITTRFQRQICEHRFPKLAEEAPGTLTISGGMATFPWDGGTADELLQRADQLALQSKRQGKNLITFGPGAQRVCGAPGPHGDIPPTRP